MVVIQNEEDNTVAWFGEHGKSLMVQVSFIVIVVYVTDVAVVCSLCQCYCGISSLVIAVLFMTVATAVVCFVLRYFLLSVIMLQ